MFEHYEKLKIPVFLAATALIIGSIFFITSLTYKIPPSAIRFETSATVTLPDLSQRLTSDIWYLDDFTEADFLEGHYTARYVLKDQISKGLDDLYIVFPAVAASGITVFFNDHFAGQQGDIASGNSNIWNSAKIFPISPSMFLHTNRVTIRLYGLYEAGVIKAPYIVSAKRNSVHLLMLKFFTEYGIWALCGSLFLVGFSLLLIGIQTLPDLDSRTVLGACALLASFFMLDFVSLEFLSFPVVELKRLLVIARHLAATLFILGHIKLLDKRPGNIAKFIMISQLIFCVVLLFPQNMTGLKNIYLFTYLGVLPLLFYLFFLLIITGRDKAYSLMLLSGVTVALTCVIRDIIAPFVSSGVIYISQYGFLVLVFSSSLFIVLDFIKNYKELYIERKKAKIYQEASVKDPLTRVFNRSIFPHIREGMENIFSVIAVDLNDFKTINDSFGHKAGDLVLQDLARCMKMTFRHDDFIVRTGGDEFFVILPGCPQANLDFLIEKLRTAILQSNLSFNTNSSGSNNTQKIAYSISVGFAYHDKAAKITQEDFERLLETADLRMYADKRVGKMDASKEEN